MTMEERLAKALTFLAADARSTYDAIGRGSIPDVSIGQWRRLQAIEDLLRDAPAVAGEAASQKQCIVVLAGSTFRGVKYFEDIKIDASPSLAEQAIADGIARLVTQRRAPAL